MQLRNSYGFEMTVPRYAQTRSRFHDTREATMLLQVKGKNIDVAQSLHDYLERKLSTIDRRLPDDTQIDVVFSNEKNPSISAHDVIEATIYAKGTTLHATEATDDFRTTIDRLTETLERQVAKYAEKRKLEPRRHAPHNGV